MDFLANYASIGFMAVDVVDPVSPGQQDLWHFVCKINRPMPPSRRDFNTCAIPVHSRMASLQTPTEPCRIHYTDVIMSAIASQITSLTIVYSTVYSDADQRKYQSSVSLAFVRGIHRGPVNSPHKWPVTRKMFPFDDVIMSCGETPRASPPFYVQRLA